MCAFLHRQTVYFCIRIDADNDKEVWEEEPSDEIFELTDGDDSSSMQPNSALLLWLVYFLALLQKR